MKNPESFQGPKAGPGPPAVRDFGFRARDVCERTQSSTPPLNENPGSAPRTLYYYYITVSRKGKNVTFSL